MKTVYYFTADWCQPCKLTRPIVEELNKDQSIAKFQIIDSDSETELVKSFQVRSVPTFILLDESGNIINRTVGGKTKQELEDFING